MRWRFDTATADPWPINFLVSASSTYTVNTDPETRSYTSEAVSVAAADLRTMGLLGRSTNQEGGGICCSDAVALGRSWTSWAAAILGCEDRASTFDVTS